MGRLRPLAGWLATILSLAPAPCVGQERAPYPWPRQQRTFAVRADRGEMPVTTPDLVAPRWRAQAIGPPDPAIPMLMSAVLPGAGQHVLARDRKWLYVAVELLGWAWYVDRRRAGGEYRDRYRDFAWEQARIQAATRVDGSFDYYETMSNWTRSGAFDEDAAAAGLQPERDPTTFNGSVWVLATGIYLPPGPPPPESDPAYQSALAYYADRAYSTEFLWDWGPPGAGAQEEFGDLIRASDRSFQRATTVLGVVFANHLVSAIDAYLTARGMAAGVEASVSPAAGPHGSGWSAAVRLRAPW